jgi:hypothetical protein
MTFFAKFAIPLGLGLAAGLVNWQVLNSRTKAVALTRVTVPLEVGDRIDVEMLEAVDVPAAFAPLIETAVPFADRGAVIQQRAHRKYRRGDLVLWQDVGSGGTPLDLRPGEDALLVSLDGVTLDVDLLTIGNYLSFRIPPPTGDAAAGPSAAQPVWIGPFRLVSIGSAVTNDDPRDDFHGDVKSISVAVKQAGSSDEAQLVRQLESFCDRQRQNDARLLGVKLHRAQD